MNKLLPTDLDLTSRLHVSPRLARARQVLHGLYLLFYLRVERMNGRFAYMDWRSNPEELR